MSKYILVFLSLMMLQRFANGQGCSDAGFCTINSLQKHTSDTIGISKNNELKFGVSYGKADNNIHIWSSNVEYNRRINENFSVGAKLTFLSQTSTLTTSSGLSDIYLNTLYTGAKNTVFTLGVKLPLNDGNKTKNDLALPMDFQSSLGTTDLIAGVTYEIKKLILATAIQQPLVQNKNLFLSEDYSANSGFIKFQSTKNYKRKGDVLVRASYPVLLNNSFKITASLLPVYHFSDDLFTNSSNKQQSITGSKGLTLNGNLFVEYAINNLNRIELNFGAPFITRSVRPDGLTRDYLFTLEYKLRF